MGSRYIMHLVCFRAGSLCGFRPSWMLTNLRPFLYLMQYSNSRTASVPSSHRYPGLNKKDWVISRFPGSPCCCQGLCLLCQGWRQGQFIPLLNMSISCVFWVLLAQRWWIVRWFCWFSGTDLYISVLQRLLALTLLPLWGWGLEDHRFWPGLLVLGEVGSDSGIDVREWKVVIPRMGDTYQLVQDFFHQQHSNQIKIVPA